MLPMCLICHELLTNPPNPHPNYARICTTNCGHVFHAGCINEWFRTLRDTAIAQVAVPMYRCPLCREGTPAPNVFELFPTVKPTRTLEQVDQIHRTIAQQETEIREKEAELQKIIEALNQKNGTNRGQSSR